LEDNEIAKNLLLDKTCKTCGFNGLYSSINYMQLLECHYWLKKDRLHEKAINPPNLPIENICDKWKKHI